jgi:ABC-2 type transport system permease protein
MPELAPTITGRARVAGNGNSAIARPAVWQAVWSLAYREVLRFVRQRNRVVGALGQPLLFWLLFGIGMNRAFTVPGQNFAQYYLPGTLVLIVLFTAIFATISIIEDRKEGFLQSVLVSPVPRWAAVLGKVAGGSAIALGQGLVFLGLALLLGMRPTVTSGLASAALLAVVAVGLTSLGTAIAWRLDSTQGFHAVMNLLLMPLWLLSGAFFPVPSADGSGTWAELGMHWLMRLNPVTYAVAGLRRLMFAGLDSSVASLVDPFWMPGLATCWGVSIVFALTMLWLAARAARGHTSGDLR